MDCKLYLIPFVMFSWLSVILEPGFCLLWLNATFFCLFLMILCLDLTGFTLATLILIGRLILCLYKHLVGPVSWLVYLVIVSYMLSLLFRTLFAMKLIVVWLLGSHLSVRLSFLMPWGYVVPLLVGSLRTPGLTIGVLCELSLLMFLSCHQHHKSAKLSTGSNSCQVVPCQVNGNIGGHHQSWSKCIDNLMNIWVKAGSTQVHCHIELISFLFAKRISASVCI